MLGLHNQSAGIKDVQIAHVRYSHHTRLSQIKRITFCEKIVSTRRARYLKIRRKSTEILVKVFITNWRISGWTKLFLRWTLLKTEIWVRKAHPIRDCWHIKENENPQPLATRCWLGFADAHPQRSHEIYDANLGLSISILLGCFVSSCPLSLNIHCKVPLGISLFWHRHTKPISTCLEVRAWLLLYYLTQFLHAVKILKLLSR